MIDVTVREHIRTTPDELLGLVMDIETYAAQIDDKIKPVLWTRRDGNRLEFASRPKLAGLRQPKVVQFCELTPGERIDIGLLPRPKNKLAHAMAHFEASFGVTAVTDGVDVTRRLRFIFSPAVRWVFEPLLRRRLDAEVRDEISRLKRYLEAR